ncbi:MAG: segregation/condensation protein A [Chloroflexi bacterium]|nr:segregation/condensation protein A [Chloroflexota bacterium]
MDFQFASHQSESYQINTDVYSGPLDLLLQLIERAELDITKLALAQVTDQFLDYLHQLEEQNASEVSAFLVVAARLVQIKSAALLPKAVIPGIPLEEDPGDELARQLIIYKRFKELSGFLEKRENEGWRTYLRLDTSPHIQVSSKLDLSELTLDMLVEVAREIFKDYNTLPPLSDVISFPRITIREKINSILEALQKEGSLSFKELLSNPNRLEVVVTFLALLELIKRRMVGANQESLFGTIELVSEPDGEFINLEDQDLEFTE